MLSSIVRSDVTCDRLRRGPIGPYVDDFVAWLLSQNFKASSIETKLRSLASWADWLEVHRAPTGGFDWVNGLIDCEQFLKINEKVFYSKGPNNHSIVAAKTFIKFLQDKGIIEKLAPLNKFSEYEVLKKFRIWLSDNRGLRETTIEFYSDLALDLIRALGADPSKYDAKAIRDFIYNRSKPHGKWRAQGITTCARAYLKFLGTTGLCSLKLADAVPRFSNYSLQSLPRALDQADVTKLIASCDEGNPYGLRDHAIILLLSRLGLRAGEVSGLTFGDFDWHNGRLAVIGKNRRREWMPLPQDVGDATLKYINAARPKFSSDRVF